MAKETTTIQCYPDDNIINKKIREYEAFGWELINNQRCQEYEGQTRDIWEDGHPLIDHYSTFNKLTFTRDKSASWYSAVTELEKEFKSKDNEIRHIESRKPDEPVYKKTVIGVFLSYLSILVIIGGILGLGISLLIGWMDSVSPLSIGMICFGILIIILRKVKNSVSMRNYERKCEAWRRDNQSSINRLRNECKNIMEKAEGMLD